MANVVVDTATSFRLLPGLGIAAPVAGAQLRFGNRRLMHETDIDPTSLESQAAHFEALGRTGIWVGELDSRSTLLGIIALAAANMGGGSDIAMETARITLMRRDPTLVANAISISQATYVKIQ